MGNFVLKFGLAFIFKKYMASMLFRESLLEFKVRLQKRAVSVVGHEKLWGSLCF